MDAKTAAMILGWMGDDFSAENVERVARWMRDTLRIGGLKDCREMIRQAVNNRRLTFALKARIDAGDSPAQAFRAVMGEAATDQMISRLYDGLRARAEA